MKQGSKEATVRWYYKLPLRLRSLFRRNKAELDLSEELQFHLQNQILVPGVICNNRLLRRLVDVLVFVPDKFWCHKTSVSEGARGNPQSGSED